MNVKQNLNNSLHLRLNASFLRSLPQLSVSGGTPPPGGHEGGGGGGSPPPSVRIKAEPVSPPRAEPQRHGQQHHTGHSSHHGHHLAPHHAHMQQQQNDGETLYYVI